MRLLRVRVLWESGNWFDARIPDANAPFGLLVNWSRPLDALMLLLAAPLAPLLGFERALFWAGMVISPVLLLLSLPVWRWAVAGLVPERLLVPMIAAMLLMPQLAMIYAAARPDHHSLQALLFILQLGLVLRLADGRLGLTVAAAAAGAVQGLALWVSVEALMVGLAFGGALALVWLRWGGATLRHMAAYGAALTATLAAALLIERGADWAVVYYDRVSVVHLWVAAAPTARLLAALAIERRRGLGLGLAGVVTLGLVYAVYPDFFRGPFAAYPADALTWVPQTGEMLPLWPSSRGAVAHGLLQLGPALVALPWMVRHVLSARRDEAAPWCVLLLALIVFLMLALFQVRWASYSQIIALPAWVLTATWLWSLRPGLRTVALGGFVVAPLLGSAWLAEPPVKPETAEVAACDWEAMQQWLIGRRPPGTAPILLTYFYGGPQLAWHTGYRVVGSPYLDIEGLGQVGRDGITDTNAVFLDRGEMARDILSRRRVDLVLVCSGGDEGQVLYGKATDSLHARLQAGQSPDWLQPIELPAGLEGFRLYRPLG